jgi:uncharacterized protein (DUF697 family)
MKKRPLVEWIERLESIASKLPGPLQKAVLSEVQPAKEIFLLRRPLRLVLKGLHVDDAKRFLDTFLPGLVRLNRTYHLDGSSDWMRVAIQDKDEVIVRLAPMVETPIPPEDVAHADFLFEFSPPEGSLPESPAGKWSCIAMAADPGIPQPEQQWTSRQVRELFQLSRSADGSFDPEQLQFVVRRLAGLVPRPAQLVLARLSGNKEAQHQLATIIVRSAAGVAGAVGAQPIPLADFPILTAIQAGMVGAVMHVSGREKNIRHASEFIAAVGANVGAALVMREGARAALKFFPGWGNAISGGVAAAGTYALGKAASAYFIEGSGIKQAKRLFEFFSRRARSKPRQLRGKKGPDL